MDGFDSEFVRRLRRREAPAFEALVVRVLPRVRGFAVRCFGSPAEQEDAVQEAFAHIFEHLDALDPLRADTVEGWACTTARRRMVDVLRRRGPATTELAEVGEEELAEPARAAEAVATAELRELLQRFRAKLKPSFVPLFDAVFLEGKEWHEARLALGLSRLRMRYVKAVVLRNLERHAPLLEYLGRGRAP